MIDSFFLLQDAAGGEAATPSGPFGLPMSSIFLVGIVVVFYFFMLRPQQQRAKKEKQFRESLSKGDKVKTIGGLYGQIEKIDDNSILLKVDDNTKLRFDKEAVKPVEEAKK